MKVRTKLSLSYLLLIIFSVIISITGIKGIEIIRERIRIESMINSALNYVQNMQANSLRYIIYGRPEYIDQIREEEQSAHSSLNEAIELMSSEQMIKSAENMITAAKDYGKLNYEYYDKDRSLNTISAERASTAAIILGKLEKLLLLEEGDNSDRSKDFILILKDAHITIYEFHKSAYLYMLSTERDVKNLHRKSWNEGINSAKKQFTELSLQYEENRIEHTLIQEIITELDNYRMNVTVYTSEEQIQKDLFPVMKTAAGNVVSNGNTVLHEIENEIIRINKTMIQVMIGILILIITLSLSVAFLITQSLSRQLGGEPHEIMSIAKEISLGNLDVSFKNGNKTGVYGSMHNMSEKLKEIVNSIIHSSQMVTTGSEQISASSQEISSGTNEQASNMEEVATSIEQLTANIANNRKNANKSRDMTRKVASDSHESRAAVSDTLDAMKEITRKIAVVEDIARQTNMLSLNAAIEAVRAGDAGKGFTVVASEVKKLAELSSTAAVEIAELSKKSVARAVLAHDMIEKIVPDMEKTSSLVEEISAASEEQNRGAEQINQAIGQLDFVVQQNAASSEELASMSEELHAQAESSKEMISYFKVDNTARLKQSDSVKLIS